MAPNNDIQGGSLSGDPIVAVSKEWAEGRKPADLCRELFARCLQLSLAVTHLCRLAGVTIDEAVVLATGHYLQSVEDKPQ